MRKKWQAYLDYLSAESHNPGTMRFFVILVYGWFLLNAAMLWPVKDLLWGETSVLVRFPAKNDLLNNVIYALVYDRVKFHLIFYLHLCSSLVSMWDWRWGFVPRVIAWFTGLMLFFSAIPAFNSGFLLMLLLAFYCIPYYSNARSVIGIALNNTVRLASIVQVVMVYALACFFKLTGSQWISGDALYYALSIDRFSSASFVASGALDHKNVWMVLNYFGLGYQLLFPFVVWIKRTRWLFLACGIAFHLFIGYFMHLWDFALAMIFSYAVFITETPRWWRGVSNIFNKS